MKEFKVSLIQCISYIIHAIYLSIIQAEHAADNFNVSILTQGYWPVYPQTPLNLPTEV
jgi:hypothetical protein